MKSRSLNRRALLAQRPKEMKAAPLLAASLLALSLCAHADTFGNGSNQFTIDFVTVGNPGNADDLGDGIFAIYGGVAYTFRIGTYETSQETIDKATSLGMTNVTAGPWTGNGPATDMTWYEAAAFVNWLNTSTGHQAAYNLTFSDGWNMSLWSSEDAWQLGGENLYRHKDAFYFLPSEDEWYKAAYHRNDGVTGNYWVYPTGSNSEPDGLDLPEDLNYQAVFSDGPSRFGVNAITDVGSASSPYGTYGQGGNVFEWMESAFDESNDTSPEFLVRRGGATSSPSSALKSATKLATNPTYSDTDLGFRVASVSPNPLQAC